MAELGEIIRERINALHQIDPSEPHDAYQVGLELDIIHEGLGKAFRIIKKEKTRRVTLFGPDRKAEEKREEEFARGYITPSEDDSNTPTYQILWKLRGDVYEELDSERHSIRPNKEKVAVLEPANRFLDDLFRARQRQPESEQTSV